MPSRLRALQFSELNGWAEDDHFAAFQCWRKSVGRLLTVPPRTRMPEVTAEDLQAAARSTPDHVQDDDAARRFFEAHFEPALLPADPGLDPYGGVEDPAQFEGFLTGYFEPVHCASASKSKSFPVPLYRRPLALTEITESNRPPNWPKSHRFGWCQDGQVVVAPDRRAIEEGALRHLCGSDEDPVLAYLSDPVSAFFVHIQGSARLKFEDGRQMRITFDGKTGHPYTSIGQLAVTRGHLNAEACGKAELEDWLRRNHEDGLSLMQENRSFIFFREVKDLDDKEGPIGAAKIPLTAGRSLAVDRLKMTFHTPIWIQTKDCAQQVSDSLGNRPFQSRLMFAQDTGSAIKGLGRGDVFFGTGDSAGKEAGKFRCNADMVVLRPRAGLDLK